MFNSPLIAPSILSADFMNLERDIRKIEEGGADWIHVDVMDGHFVPNLTIGVPHVKQLKRISDLPLDVHLMISNPLEQLPWYLKAEPSMVTVHIEAFDCETDVKAAIELIHDAGVRACLALKPDAPVSALKPFISDLDMVLVMSVFPGFSGQSYIEGSDIRVGEVSEMAKAAGVSPLIQVDGGMGDNQATEDVCSRGADVLVAGSAVFGKQDIPAAISAIRRRASMARA